MTNAEIPRTDTGASEPPQTPSGGAESPPQPSGASEGADTATDAAGGQQEPRGRAVLTVTVDAPDQTNADRWAQAIRGFVHAEFGDTMRLVSTVTGGPLASSPDSDTAAVDDLVTRWAQAVMDQDWGCGCCADTDDALRADTADTLRHFAHQLAEQIRARIGPATDRDPAPAEDGMRWAADLIDPPTAPGTCTATIDSFGFRRCVQPAGHYDEARTPDFYAEPRDPGGWHQSEPDDDGNPTTWLDWAFGAVPHTADEAKDPT